MKVLCHVCCAPCYGYVIKSLKSQGHKVTGLFYNPNIQPYQEFRKRMHEAQRFAYLTNAEIEFIDEYDITVWLKGVMAEMDKGNERCVFCYYGRLDRTAGYAKENGFQAFTTTLLGSTHQDHDCIRKICADVAQKHGIQFLYEDFRLGKKEAHRTSQELGLYRQGYCGCVFSEEERYKPDDDDLA